MKLSFGILASCHVAYAQYKPKKWHSKWVQKSAQSPMKAFGRSLTAGVEQNPCENATLTFIDENEIENGYWVCPEMTEAQSEISCFGKCNEGHEQQWKRALVIVQCKNPPNTKSKVKGDLVCSENSSEEEKCKNAESDFISQNPIENGHFVCKDDTENEHRICTATCDDENAQSRWKSGIFYVVCGEKIKIKNKLKGELACLSTSSENLCQAVIDNGDINIPSGSLVYTHEKKGTLNYDVKCDDDKIMGSASCKDGKFWSKKLRDFPNTCNSSMVCREEQAYNVTDIGDGEWKCKNKQPNEMFCKGKCNQEKSKMNDGSILKKFKSYYF
ncbi:unnamed protein product [Oikopleura dioica]|uniref:Uncharacterized protein n=1 Tax=Oikopleura dioica TaxID=34765 RepID=E4WSU5_OIKDI|nr:unnamed protein product [Oikopleura dioica]